MSDEQYPFETGDHLSAAALNAALAQGRSNQWVTGSGVPSDSLGSDGDMYLDSDTGDVYQKQSGAYVIVASLAGTPGPPGAAGAPGSAGPPGPAGTGISSIATSGTGISGGPITTSGTLSVAWNAGTVSAIGSGLSLAGGTLTSTGGGGGAPSGAAGGDLAGTYPNPTLSTTGVSVGTYGDATHVPVLGIDTKGRITSAGIAIVSGGPPSGPAGGDLSGTYPNPTVATIGGVAGPFLPTAGGTLTGRLTTTNGDIAAAAGYSDLNIFTPATVDAGDGTLWINLNTGQATTGSSGFVSAQTGSVTTGTSGGVILTSGAATSAGTSGDVDIATGQITGAGTSGGIYIHTRQASAGTSGIVAISTGNASGAGKSSGNITLTTGTAASGATRGTITLDAASLTLPARSVSYAALPVEVQQVPIPFVFSGKPATGATINVPMPWAITVPASLAGCVVYDATQATSSAAFVLNKISGGTTISALGTITVTTTTHVSATLTGAGGSLAIGDVLQIVAPTQDSTLSDIGITVLCSRV